MNAIAFPNAPAIIRDAVNGHNLCPGLWQGTDRCVMGHLVPGAMSIEDCSDAGWPRWLTKLCVYLFDNAGTDEEREEFSVQLASAVSTPFGPDAAMHAYIAVLTPHISHSKVSAYYIETEAFGYATAYSGLRLPEARRALIDALLASRVLNPAARVLEVAL